MVRNIFFAPNPRYSGKVVEKRKRKKATTKLFALQENVINAMQLIYLQAKT